MNYENIIELLQQEFPDIKERIEAEDYISGLPHCIFEIIVVPYVKNLCENNRKEELTRIGNFLENMAACSDKGVTNLLSVSFLEPIVLADREIIPCLQNYLGKETLKELNYWQKRYEQ